MTYFDEQAERAAIDAWIIREPDYHEPLPVSCEICDEPHDEGEHCQNENCACQSCGEPLPEDTGETVHCENCCECPVCYPDEIRYYLWDTLGLPRDYDIALITPSRITLELAAADYELAEKEDLDTFIQTLLDWTEQRSWIYTSQALLKRGYTEFAQVVTKTARSFDELTQPR